MPINGALTKGGSTTTTSKYLEIPAIETSVTPIYSQSLQDGMDMTTISATNSDNYLQVKVNGITTNYIQVPAIETSITGIAENSL